MITTYRYTFSSRDGFHRFTDFLADKGMNFSCGHTMAGNAHAFFVALDQELPFSPKGEDEEEDEIYALLDSVGSFTGSMGYDRPLDIDTVRIPEFSEMW